MKVLSFCLFFYLLNFVFSDNLAYGKEESLGSIYLGDPYILHDGDTYYLYGTSSDDGIEVFKSTDLVHWSTPCGVKNGFALRKEDVWGDNRFWAPEVYKINSKYFMFFSVEEHIAVAISNSPMGPFVQEKQQPLLESKAIDSHLFIDDNGKKYLYYVAFTNGNVIWMCEMNDDLLSVKTNTIKECFGRSQPWEFSPKQPAGNVNEGPFIIKNKKTYYLVYSANHYASPDYGLGYATASSPEGPWVKYKGNPILQSPDTLSGTGHCSLFKDKNGELNVVYHAHYSRQKIHPRRVFINKCSFVKEKGEKLPVLRILPARIDPQTTAYISNPLFNGTDPWVIHKNSFYYWCASSHGGIEISRSHYLTYKKESRKVGSSPDTRWNRKNIWAS
jgi:xylan 1,4-beta-xylosidase